MKVEVKGYIVSNDLKEIYDYFGISSTCPQDILTAINDANGEKLDVEISTCYGGDIFAGSSIYAALKGYKGGVNIMITGLAASAASIIAMAGQSEMSPTAMMMVHRVSSFTRGNYHDMDRESESLQQADKAMAAAYTSKSGMDETDALAMMDKETWLTAKQAVEKKLVDKVMFSDDTQLVNSFGPGMIPQAVIDRTRQLIKNNTNAADPITPPNQNSEIDFANAKLNLIEKTIF